MILFIKIYFCLLIQAVPEGDWFCIACKPKDSKPKEKAKKRRTNFEDEIEEEPSFTKETRHNRAKKVIESDGDDAEIEESEQETCENFLSQFLIIKKKIFKLT